MYNNHNNNNILHNNDTEHLHVRIRFNGSRLLKI